MATPRYINRPDSSAADEFKRSLSGMVNTMLERKRSQQDFEQALLMDTQSFERGLWTEDRARKEREEAAARAEALYQQRRDEGKADLQDRLEDQRDYAEEVRDEARGHAKRQDQTTAVQAAINGYLLAGGSAEEVEKIVESVTPGNKDTGLDSLAPEGGENKVNAVVSKLKSETFAKVKEKYSEGKLTDNIGKLQDALAELGDPPAEFKREDDELDKDYKIRLLARLVPAENRRLKENADIAFSKKLRLQAEAAGIPEAEYVNKPNSAIIAALKAKGQGDQVENLFRVNNFATYQDLLSQIKFLEGKKVDVTEAQALADTLLKDLSDANVVHDLREKVLPLFVATKKRQFAVELWDSDRQMDDLHEDAGKPKWTLDFVLRDKASRDDMREKEIITKGQWDELNTQANTGDPKDLDRVIKDFTKPGGQNTFIQAGNADAVSAYMVKKAADQMGVNDDEEELIEAVENLPYVLADDRLGHKITALFAKQKAIIANRNAFLQEKPVGVGTGLVFGDWQQAEAARVPPSTTPPTPDTPGASVPNPLGTLDLTGTPALALQGQLTDAEVHANALKKKDAALANRIKSAQSGRSTQSKMKALAAARKEKKEVEHDLGLANSKVDQLNAAIAAQPVPGEGVPAPAAPPTGLPIGPQTSPALVPTADDTEKLTSMLLQGGKSEKEALASAAAIVDILEGRSAPPPGIDVSQFQAILDEARRIYGAPGTMGMPPQPPQTPDGQFEEDERGTALWAPHATSAPAIAAQPNLPLIQPQGPAPLTPTPVTPSVPTSIPPGGRYDVPNALPPTPGTRMPAVPLAPTPVVPSLPMPANPGLRFDVPNALPRTPGTLPAPPSAPIPVTPSAPVPFPPGMQYMVPNALPRTPGTGMPAVPLAPTPVTPSAPVPFPPGMQYMVPNAIPPSPRGPTPQLPPPPQPAIPQLPPTLQQVAELEQAKAQTAADTAKLERLGGTLRSIPAISARMPLAPQGVPRPAGPDPRDLSPVTPSAPVPIEIDPTVLPSPDGAIGSLPIPAQVPAESLGEPDVPLGEIPPPSVISAEAEVEGGIPDTYLLAALIMKAEREKGRPVTADAAYAEVLKINETVAGWSDKEIQDNAEYIFNIKIMARVARDMDKDEVRRLLSTLTPQGEPRGPTPKLPPPPLPQPAPPLPGMSLPPLPGLPGLPGARPAPTAPPELPPLPNK